LQARRWEKSCVQNRAKKKKKERLSGQDWLVTRREKGTRQPKQKKKHQKGRKRRKSKKVKYIESAQKKHHYPLSRKTSTEKKVAMKSGNGCSG